MKKAKAKIIGAIVLAIVAFLYYYFTLPAINIHSRDFWFFIGILVAVLALIYAWKKFYLYWQQLLLCILWERYFLLQS